MKTTLMKLKTTPMNARLAMEFFFVVDFFGISCERLNLDLLLPITEIIMVGVISY